MENQLTVWADSTANIKGKKFFLSYFFIKRTRFGSSRKSNGRNKKIGDLINCATHSVHMVPPPLSFLLDLRSL